MQPVLKFTSPIVHILLWLLGYSVAFFFIPKPFFSNPAVWVTIIIAFYLNVYWLIPKYLNEEKHWLRYLTLALTVIVAVTTIEFILDYSLQFVPVYIEGKTQKTLLESIILLWGMIFLKTLIVLPLSFLFQFAKDLMLWKKVSVFAEISLHILIIGMLYLFSMMAPPHWAPELDPFLFIFKAGYKLFILAINLSFFYLNAFWLIPQLLVKRRYTRYFIALLLLFAISITLEFGIYHLPVFSPDQISVLMHTIRVDAIFKLLILLISFLYRFSKDWFEHEEQKTRLESDKLSAELDLLKFQIHPHFLFNTLNNIYSLAMQEDSPKTVRSLGKLGGIMHYMLEECQQTYVSLSQELEYLQQYIDLQQLRADQNNITVNMDIDGKAGILKIAPMLLIAFVENAFKHGISMREPSFINLKIAISANEFYFNIANAVHQRKQVLNGTGLGLKNVQRRLMMLYPQRHTLIIEEKNQGFKVSLTIRLDEV